MVRLKNRYFLCKVNFPIPDQSDVMLTSQEFRKAIEKATRQIFGDYGLSIVGNRLRVMKVSTHSKTAIVRVQHRATRMLSQTLPFIRQHQKTDITIQTLHVTGTLATCCKALIKHERRTLLELLRNTTKKDHRKKIQEALLSCTMDFQDEKIESDDEFR